MAKRDVEFSIGADNSDLKRDVVQAEAEIQDLAKAFVDAFEEAGASQEEFEQGLNKLADELEAIGNEATAIDKVKEKIEPVVERANEWKNAFEETRGIALDIASKVSMVYLGVVDVVEQAQKYREILIETLELEIGLTREKERQKELEKDIDSVRKDSLKALIESGDAEGIAARGRATLQARAITQQQAREAGQAALESEQRVRTTGSQLLGLLGRVGGVTGGAGFGTRASELNRQTQERLQKLSEQQNNELKQLRDALIKIRREEKEQNDRNAAKIAEAAKPKGMRQ